MQKCSFNSPYSPSTVNLRCVRQSSCVVATPHTLIRYDTSPPSWARFFANFWNSTNLFFFFSPLLHRFLQFRLFRCRTRSDLLDSLLLTLFRFLRILAPRQLPWILLTRTKFVKLFSFFFFFRFLLLLTPILSQQICCIATQFSQPVFCVTYFPILAFISTLLLVFSL